MVERRTRLLTSEIIDVRHFDPRDFLPLLEAEARAWHTNLRWDFASSAKLIASCLDEKRLSGYAAVREGRILGYSFFFYEGDKGLIGNLFVEPGGSGVEEAGRLLEHVIETLTAIPVVRRVEAQLPHFTLEQLEPSFLARGFKSYLRRFMAISLADRPRRAVPGAAGQAARSVAVSFGDFLIEPWEPSYDRPAAKLLYYTYLNHVDAVINDQYGSEAGAFRLVENIMHHRGCGEHLPRASRIAIHRPSQKLAAILALTSVREHTGHIPQIAVAPEFQNAGLGAALMELGFDDLAARGYQEVSLTVTDFNSGAVKLYERTGFKTFATFGAYVWTRP